MFLKIAAWEKNKTFSCRAFGWLWSQGFIKSWIFSFYKMFWWLIHRKKVCCKSYVLDMWYISSIWWPLMYVQIILYVLYVYIFAGKAFCLYISLNAYTNMHSCLLMLVCSCLLVYASMPLRERVFLIACLCVCLNVNMALCVCYISVSHLFLKHCGEWEVWIRLNPVELTPVSLSARLFNGPVLHFQHW